MLRKAAKVAYTLRVTSYIGVVEKDPGSAWGIWFPDVAGCTSAADGLDDLFLNACQALEFHLDGMEAPSPRPAEEVLMLQEVRAAFGRGAFLMMVPLLTAGEIEARTNDSKRAGTCVTGVVGKDPGSAYGIWFPDVPGCHSAAYEEKDILEMASAVLAMHLDGERALPRARPLTEILQIKEVREDLARGNFLVAVPLPSAGRGSRE